MPNGTQSKMAPLKGATTQENAAMLVSACSLQWYGLVPSNVPRDDRKQVSNGELFTIQPNTIFRSRAELKNRGVDDQMIDHWVSRGALRYQTMEGLLRGRVSLTGAGAPIQTGNTDGTNPNLNVAPNRAGMVFGWNPANLEKYDLEGLKEILASADPTIQPPDSRQGIIEIMSRDFRN